jgi:hypothetical protein
MSKLCTRAAALVLFAVAVASCGGAAAVPAARGADEAGFADATPEAAQAALDLAEQNLFRAIGGPAMGFAQPPGEKVAAGGKSRAPDPSATAQPRAEPPPPPVQQVQPAQPSYTPPAAPAPADQADAAQASDDKRRRLAEREAPRPAADPCLTACSALASMERATDHLCGLAGAADGRCASARERVRNALARVQAACPACAR